MYIRSSCDASVRLVWAVRDHETVTNIRRLIFFLCYCGFSKHLFKKVKTLDMRHTCQRDLRVTRVTQ